MNTLIHCCSLYFALVDILNLLDLFSDIFVPAPFIDLLFLHSLYLNFFFFALQLPQHLDK